MSDVFICYSRENQGFVYKLHSAFQATGRQTWVNWQDGLPTGGGWQDIQNGIEGANAFVLVLSPDAIASRSCQQEIEHAIHHHKQIVPLVYCNGFVLDPDNPMHQTLKRHHWLLFTEPDQFENMFQKVLEILDADLEAVQTHTQLLVRSLEWDSNARNDSFLLRGDELKAAEQWLTVDHSLPPTQQHETYIQKSREVEDANQRIQQAGSQAKTLTRVGALILGGAIAVAATVGLSSWLTERKLETATVANRIDATNVNALKQFEAAQLPALLTALREARTLQEIAPTAKTTDDYPTVSPIFALRSMLGQIREQNQIRTSSDNIGAIAFSPDSKLVATGGSGKVQIWTIAGEPRAEFKLPKNRRIRALSFEAKGREILVVTEDSSLGRWNLEGKLIAWKPQRILIKQAQFSPDRQEFATVRDNGTAQIWSIAGTLKANFKKRKANFFENAQFASINYTGDVIVTGSVSGTIDWWTRQGQPLRNKPSLKNEGGISALRISPQNQIASLHRNEVRLWGNDKIPIWQSLGDRVEFSPKGQHLAISQRDGTLELWNLSQQRPDGTPLLQPLPDSKPILKTTHENRLYAMSFSPDGRYLATGGAGRVLRLWNLSDVVPLASTHDAEILGLSVMSDGAIATADKAGNAILWNKTQRRELHASEVPMWSITASPDGTVIATGDEHGRVHLKNRKGQALKTFKAHVGRIVAVKFNPTGTEIATAAADGAKLWDLSGQELRTWIQNERVFDLAFRSDGKQVATTAAGGVVKLWDESGKFVRSLPVNRTEIHSLTFVGNQLITGGADGEVTLWKTSGERDSSFLAHSTGIYGLNLSPNGKQILTSGGNGIVRLWTLNGQQLGEWVGSKVAFSHNGQQIITANRTGTLSIVENETLEQLLGQSCLWMKDYLTNNPTVVERDRKLCQNL